MDKHDSALIAALRKDARTSVSDLSDALGVSRATIRNRIDKLIENKVILGFTVVLEDESHDFPVSGITCIEISGKGNDEIVRNLSGFIEVQAIHTTNGRWDCVVEFGCENLEALDEFLRQLRLVEGINNSETSLYLATKRSTRALR